MTRGEDFVRTARDTLVGKTKGLNTILDKIEAAVTIDDATDSSNLKKLLLTSKIAHEELCEKASLVRCVHLFPWMRRLVLTYWTYVWFCENQVREHFINLADNKRAKPKAAAANGRAGGPRSGGRSDQRVDLSPSRYFRS